jgi:hypothetical protein
MINARNFPVFGSCSYFVLDNTNETALFGTVEQPATITCFSVPNPLRPAAPEPFTECTFWKANCPNMVWAWIFVVTVPILVVILIAVIIGFVALQKHMKESDVTTAPSEHEKID